ncbi:hypothetical protein [Alkalihalobacillus pseudalcaliphilus]|uniref:hypothetical protein n=1 Tax=Alkalihalobacillus pseudalcaliphilus TaxID=79884 RepID=UPI00064D8A26|nr:hypothetical protein [Alkalihalobacillus pseudalcaliphilus]KMK75006.1 hypothetical protein AB990_16175 [Alkalihalobacillus pseudalcaliphilus]
MNFGFYFQKWFKSFLEYLAYFPLLLYVGVASLPSTEKVVYWLLSVPIIFAISLFIGMSLKITRRIWKIIFSLLLSIAATYLFLGSSISPGYFIFFAFVLLLNMRGFYYSSQLIEELVPVRLLWYGFVGYFFAYFFYRMYDLLTPYEVVLNVVGIFYLIITFFYSNIRHLKEATLTGKVNPFLSRATKRQNRFYLIIFLAVILVIFTGGYIQDLFRTLWNGFVQLLLLLEPPDIGDVDELVPEFESEEDELIMEELGYEEHNEIPWLNAIMVAFLGTGLLFFIVYLLTKSKALMKWLTDIREGFFTKKPDDEAFVDEKEKLMSAKELSKQLGNRLKNWLQSKVVSKPSIDDFTTNEEKVRFIFREFIEKQGKGLQVRKDQSAHEILKLIEIEEKKLGKSLLDDQYHLARYGLTNINDQDVEKLRKWLISLEESD